MTIESAEMSTRDVRANLADAVNRAIAGGVTHVLQNRRRVAAIVSRAVGEAAEQVSVEEIEARATLRKRGVAYEDFLVACLRAVNATPDSMLKSLARFMPTAERPDKPAR